MESSCRVVLKILIVAQVIRLHLVAIRRWLATVFLIWSALAGALSLGAAYLPESAFISSMQDYAWGQVRAPSSSTEDLVSVQLIAVLVGPAIFVVQLSHEPSAGSDIDCGWRYKCQM